MSGRALRGAAGPTREGSTVGIFGFDGRLGGGGGKRRQPKKSTGSPPPSKPAAGQPANKPKRKGRK